MPKGLTTVAVVGAALTILLTGCGVQRTSTNVSIRTGVAFAGAGQVSIKGDGDGWYYSMPSDVLWTDDAGTLHQGSRPACLPEPGSSGRVRFATTQVTENGITSRPVVQVFSAVSAERKPA